MGAARPLRVGLFFNARREQGGLYQYALTLVHCLHEHAPEHHYHLFQATLEDLPLTLSRPNWTVTRLSQPSLAPRLAIEVALLRLARWGWRKPVPVLPMYSAIRRAACDIMLYVKPSVQAFLWPLRAMFPIHDLQHRLQPEFPEVSADGEWQRREYQYQNAVPRAAAILTDSDVGRDDVLHSYPQAAPERVHVLPYLAPTYLSAAVTDADLARVRDRYTLPPAFLFYPAAFWAHKNHAQIMHALKILRERHDWRPPLVLAGGLSRGYPEIRALTIELGLADQVHFLGYVPDTDLYPLYRLAWALVMPTYFGPTNIPILEAWALECPVVTSTARGLPEQVGEAGLVADPRQPEALADCLWRLQVEPDLRSTLIERGRRRVAAWTPADFGQRLSGLLSRSVVDGSPH